MTTTGYYYPSPTNDSEGWCDIYYVRNHMYVRQEASLVTRTPVDLAKPLCDMMNHFMEISEE
jgi:hypothetical protein